MTAEVIKITDPATGASAEVLTSLGFNCFSWRLVLTDGPREMLWANDNFRSGEERPSSGGTPLLFPFPGRIGAARFEFEGKTYELPPGDAFGNAIHGFVFNRPWRVTETTGDAVTAEFQGSVDAPETLAYWPSDYKLAATYRIAATTLALEIEYSNPGEANLPCAIGTHAYFRLPLAEGGTMAETVIRAPVDRQWDLESMLPAGGPRPVDGATPLAGGVAIGDQAYDTPYGVPAGTNPIVTEVVDPASGRTLRQTTDGTFGCCVIYTPGHREAVCLEPYQCVPDPFRLESEGQATGLQVLAPGEVRRTRITLEVTG